METSHVVFSLRDNGGRRLGVDRRRFSYADHAPERRLGEERRSGQDRRGEAERRTESDRRSGSHLDSLANASVKPRDSFELTQLPAPETIEVHVDGIQTTTGWQYDASINAIVFEPDHIPPVGATIEIEYLLMPDCEG